MDLEEKIEQNPIKSNEDYDSESLEGSARNNFIKKVYSILGMQLLVTVSFVLFNMFNAAFAKFQAENMAIFWIVFVISLVSLIALACVPGLAAKSPINVILLSVFTLAESYLVSMICSLYTPESVLNAAIATLGATIGLTLYAIKTKSDFSDMYSKCSGKNELI